MPETTVNYGWRIPFTDGSDLIVPEDVRAPIIAIDAKMKSSRVSDTKRGLYDAVGTANGEHTIAHGLGIVPAWIGTTHIAAAAGPGTPAFVSVVDGSVTATQFKVRLYTSTGAVYTGSVKFYWECH